MVSPELIMVSPELIGMVSPELKWAILGAPYERLRSDMARQVEVFAQWSLRMPIEQVSGTGLSCHLVTFDAGGRERVEPDGELASHRALTVLAGEPVTDVFLLATAGRVTSPQREGSMTLGSGRWPTAKPTSSGWMRRGVGRFGRC